MHLYYILHTQDGHTKVHYETSGESRLDVFNSPQVWMSIYMESCRMPFKFPGCHQFLISFSRGLKSLSKRLQPGGQTHRGRKIKTLPNIASSCIQSRNTLSYFLKSELYVHFLLITWPTLRLSIHLDTEE